MAEIKENEKRGDTFTKHQLLKSKKYANRTDLLSVLLQQDKRYTLKEVDKVVNDFMKGKVK